MNAALILFFLTVFLFNPANGFVFRTSRHSTITLGANVPEYLEKAREMVDRAEVPHEVLVSIAFNIFDTEKRLALEHAEAEKRLALERSNAEKDLGLLLQKAEFNENSLRHYYSKKISFISLRYKNKNNIYYKMYYRYSTHDC